jgi:hypothetical protein
MKFKRPASFLLPLLFCLSAIGGTAEIGKWVDKNGQVHYSAPSPTNAKPTETLALEPLASKKPSEHAQMSAQQRVNDANKWLQSAHSQLPQQSQARETAWSDQQKQAAECRVLKQRLVNYEDAAINYDVNEQGDHYPLNQHNNANNYSSICAIKLLSIVTFNSSN